jgi:hypothetical protein
LVISLSVALFLGACGVETSSSITSGQEVTQPPSQNPNPPTPPQNNNGDTNNTVPDQNSTNGDNGNSGNSKIPDTDFDYKDAIEDPNACYTIGYRISSDASYDGSSLNENGASGFIIADQGLVLRSEHMSQNNASTWVTLFYKGFPGVSHLNNQGVTSYKMEDVFYLSYDVAWSDQSIDGITNVMYLQSKKDEDGKPDCYRLELNSTIGSRIGVQKVYRLKK